MRTIITSSVIAVLMLSITTSAEAQIFKRLKKRAKDAVARKAEEKMNRELEKRADQMVEKSWDSIFGNLEEGKDGGSGQRSMFNINSNATTEDTYHFDIVTTMEIKTEKKKGKPDPPMNMQMYFNENQKYTGTKFRGKDIDQQNGEVVIIYDFKNSAMVMLMSSKKDKFSFAYDWQQALDKAKDWEADSSEARKDPSGNISQDEAEQWEGYTKIGTKKIAGYTSEGYRTENKEGVSEIWVSREVAYGLESMFQANTNSKYLRGKVPANYPHGMLMEMTHEDADSGDKTIMRVTDIKKNANVNYAMSDYPAMSLGKKKN